MAKHLAPARAPLVSQCFYELRNRESWFCSQVRETGGGRGDGIFLEECQNQIWYPDLRQPTTAPSPKPGLHLKIPASLPQTLTRQVPGWGRTDLQGGPRPGFTQQVWGAFLWDDDSLSLSLGNDACKTTPDRAGVRLMRTAGAVPTACCF